jgi:hypothetical protein
MRGIKVLTRTIVIVADDVSDEQIRTLQKCLTRFEDQTFSIHMAVRRLLAPLRLDGSFVIEPEFVVRREHQEAIKLVAS